MTGTEFRRYAFRTPEQWTHGVGFRLQSLPRGGFQLFSVAAFHSWVTQADEAGSARGLDVDASGRVLWIHRHDGQLYRYDPGSGLLEPLIPLGPGGTDFGRMLRTNGRIWIHDRGRSRVLALRADTFQILAEIRSPGGVDIASGGGRLFTVDAEAISSFDSSTGKPLGVFPLPPGASAVSLGADPRGQRLYVIDPCARGFLRFAADGRFDGEFARFDDVAPTFTPHLLCVDHRGNLFGSAGDSIHEFAPDGGYIGHTGALGPATAIGAISWGGDGALYAADRAGIARFGRETGIAGNRGHFYSGTLDSGSDGRDTWHRLDAAADISENGAIDIYYATSNESRVAERVTAILRDTSGTAEKVIALEHALADLWRGPLQLRAPQQPIAPASADALVTYPTHSLLFDQDSGRYLWLKIGISGLAPQATAAVREIHVYYPRLSYLRYLPAVYQEDKASRDFLERFLSMFETVLSGLERTIGNLPALYDPRQTPTALLDWLAQWLDVAVEEDWSADVKRRLISDASRLYERKGTPAGLADFIEIVTGHRPMIRESFATERPLVLGSARQLGTDTRLTAQPVEDRPPHDQTRLGRSIVGRSHIHADTTLPVDALQAAAHAFTVVLNLTPQQFRRHKRGLHRVIREQSPAHVAYNVRAAVGAGLGSDAVVDVSWRVEDPQPLYLGYSALGRSICRRGVSYGPELGHDATLLGRSGGWTSASAGCCGE